MTARRRTTPVDERSSEAFTLRSIPPVEVVPASG
jgi:hypothetical protein